MKDYFTVFEPVDYDRQSIIDLCAEYDNKNLWDDVYPGVKLKSRRSAEDFLTAVGVRQILDSFNPELEITYKNCQMLCFDPGDRGVLHKDTDRLCGVLFPVTPIGDQFSCIEFFDEEKNKIHELNYSDQAIILNVLQYHNVQQTAVRRINFQIDFGILYHDIVAAYNHGYLFTKQEAHRTA